MIKKVKAYYPVGRGLDEAAIADAAKDQGEAAAKQAEARRKGLAEAVDREEKRLTDAVGEQIGKYEAATGKATAVQKFQTALRAGLPGRAIETFKADPSAFAENQVHVALLVLNLELASGRLEDAAKDFDDLSVGFDDLLKSLPPPQGEEFQAGVRDVEFRKCVLEGSYIRAGVVWEQLNGNGRFPKVAAGDVGKLAVLRPEFQPEPAAAAVLGGPAVIPVNQPPQSLFKTFAQQPAVPVLTALVNESHYHHTRGLLFLIEGSVGEAKTHFALAPAPQGVTTLPIPWADLDKQFVRMIDAAGK
jgi:hypothetical protein